MAQRTRPQAESLYGMPQPLQSNLVPPVIAKRAPTTVDTGYPLGQNWIDKTNNAAYQLTSVAAGAANWQALGGGSTQISTLTADTGGALSPTAGNINILGTASQIATTGSGSTITVSIPTTFSIGSTSGSAGGTISVGTGNFSLATAVTSTVAIGSAAQTGTITVGQSTAGQTVSISSGVNAGAQIVNVAAGASAANSTVNVLSGNATSGTQTLNLATGTGGKTVHIADGAGVNTVTLGSTNTTSATTIQSGSGDVTVLGGNLKITTAAKQLQMEGGAVTDFIGQATLVTGAVTVSNTNIATADKIFVSRHGVNGATALGVFDVSISNATSFTITSRKPADATTETNDTSIVDYFIVRQL